MALKVGLGPVVEFFSVFSFKVDTAMRHGVAKVIMPIGAMEAITAASGDLIAGEVHDIRDVREIVIGVDGLGAAFHFRVAEFDPDVKGAGGSSTPEASGNREFIDKLIVFIGIELLVAKINVNAFISSGLAED